jgi:hypothetical protein
VVPPPVKHRGFWLIPRKDASGWHVVILDTGERTMSFSTAEHAFDQGSKVIDELLANGSLKR